MARVSLTEVDGAYILRRCDEATVRDGPRNEWWDTVERYRHRLHTVPVPGAWDKLTRPIRTTIIDETVRVTTSILRQGFPSFRVPPSSLSRQAQLDTSKREKWLAAVWQELDQSGGPHRPYVDEIDQAVMFGFACPKLLYRPDAWDARQYDRREGEDDRGYTDRIGRYRQTAPLPFVWQVPDPRTVHLWYEGGRLVEVLETSQRVRQDVARRYGDVGVVYNTRKGRLENPRLGPPVAASASGISSGALQESVDFAEHWYLHPTRGAVVTYMADRSVLDKIDAGYPLIPYFPYFGLSTSSRSPVYEAQSVVGPAIELVAALDTALTARHNWAQINAFPMGVWRQRAGATASPVDAGGSPVQALEFRPGEFQSVYPDDTLEWLQAPPAGSDLGEFSTLLLELIDRSTGITDILRGRASSGTPAWLGAQLQAASRRIFDPITDNQAVSFKERCKFLYWLVERHGESIYVLGELTGKRGKKRGYLSLGPDDVQSYYAVEVEISTLSDDRRVIWGQFGLQQQEKGAISMQTHREDFLQLAAPEEEERKVLTEKVTNSPEFGQMIMEKFRRIVAGREEEVRQQLGIPGMQQAVQASGQASGQVPLEMAAQLAGQAPMQPGGVAAIPGTPSPRAPVPGLGIPMVPGVQGPIVG